MPHFAAKCSKSSTSEGSNFTPRGKPGHSVETYMQRNISNETSSIIQTHAKLFQEMNPVTEVKYANFPVGTLNNWINFVYHKEKKPEG